MLKTANGFVNELKLKKTSEYATSSSNLSTSSIWEQIQSLAPFVKKSIPNSEADRMRKVRIGSKNEQNERTLIWLEDLIVGKEVILSHSPLLFGQQSRGIVDSVEFVKRRIVITVTTENEGLIWEDTDVWLLPGEQESSSTASSFNLETDENVIEENRNGTEDQPDVVSEKPSESPIPSIYLDIKEESSETKLSDVEPVETLTSAEPKEIKVETNEDMDQTELFQSINGWKYLDGQFQRKRQKYSGVWKSVYRTELRMTPVDSENAPLLKYVKDNVALRFSDDIDELGDVFVKIVRKSVTSEWKTITLGVTGFQRKDVDISLIKSKTFYLNVDDGDEDELASLSSEDNILSGYPIEQNEEELCEKIGELSMTDMCIKTWFTTRGNVPFFRLLLVSCSNKSMSHFKKLQGCHVLLTSSRGGECLLGVVSKVMKDEIVMTVIGTPRNQKPMYISKQDKFTIRLDPEYEERARNFKGLEERLESLRRRLIFNGDLRYNRHWHEIDPSGQKKTFATFTFKNPAFSEVPVGTTILLSKCWENTGKLEKKAEFVFAVRSDKKCHRVNPYQLVFEIKFTKTLVKNSPDFKLTDAYYYVDFDFSQAISKDPHYRLYDIRENGAGARETARSSCYIDESRPFYVFENSLIPQTRNRNSLQTSTKNGPITAQTTQLPSQPPKNDFTQTSQLDSKKHKELGMVKYEQIIGNENGNYVIRLLVCPGSNTKKEEWNIGFRLVICDTSRMIRIRGNIHDTKGAYIAFLVDNKSSDMKFLETNPGSTLMCFREL